MTIIILTLEKIMNITNLPGSHRSNLPGLCLDSPCIMVIILMMIRQHCRLTICRLVEFVRIRSKYKQQSDDAGLSNDDHKHDKVDAHTRGCNGYGGDDDGEVGDDDDGVVGDDDDDDGVTFPNGCCRGS